MRTIEQELDTRQLRRMRAEDRYLTRLEKLEKAAAELIGELQRHDGITYYINLRPLARGRVKESKSFHALSDYLIRNNYV